MEPIDPRKVQTYTFRAVELDGTVREVEMNADQVLDIASGKPIAYYPRDERVTVGADGTITRRRESAVPAAREA